jgi:hypothetical protein
VARNATLKKIFARNAQRATVLQKPWSRATLDFSLF